MLVWKLILLHWMQLALLFDLTGEGLGSPFFYLLNNTIVMLYSTTGSKTELQAVNQILASVGQAPVTAIDTETITNQDGDQVTVVSNPDVAIAYDTLQEVSREVQSEGWTFNKEFNYPFSPNNAGHIVWPNNVLQMDLSDDPRYVSYREYDTVKRDGKLYDRVTHSNEWTTTVYCDVVWYFDWEDLPSPIQDYITCRAATVASSRLVGDANQYQILQQKEAYARALALEYECNQGDYSMFGYPRQGTYYQSYQPYNTLQRF
jgi:hypothetical protein